MRLVLVLGLALFATACYKEPEDQTRLKFLVDGKLIVDEKAAGKDQAALTARHAELIRVLEGSCQSREGGQALRAFLESRHQMRQSASIELERAMAMASGKLGVSTSVSKVEVAPGQLSCVESATN